MQKVLIWDHTGESAKWRETYLEKENVEVIRTITQSESVSEILLQKDAWDWLLIFERNMRKAFDATVQTLKLPLEKVIYALDVQSWLQKPKAIYNILSNSGGGYHVVGIPSTAVVK